MQYRSCIWCSRYVGCRPRINRMRKIKQNHGSATRADIRLRIAVMDQTGAHCATFDEGVPA